MMYYALKSALLLTLLYGGFSALLSRETFHCFNRITLLGIVLLSLVLPAVHITTSTPAPIVLEQYWEEKAMAEEQVPAVEESPAHTTVVSVTPQASADNPLKEKDFWESLYIIGIAVALVRFIHRSILLTRSLQGGLRISDKQGNTVIIKDGEFPPFSFMHWICISVGDYERHRRSILTHEQAHARLGHSWDALLLELLQVVQWFNPFAWLLGRELRAVHEYEADEAVICQGTDAKQYQQLLVIKAVGNRLQPFANTLNRGSLKQRINMMQQQKSNRWRMLRATFAVPMAALALVAFATPEVKTDEVQQAVLSDESKPLVEYKTHEKWGKGYRDYYRVNLGEGVWIESNGASHIEEKFFTYSFDNTNNAKVPRKTTMMLNGVPFDQNSLPKLTSKDLKKIEIKNAENAMLASDANGKALSVKGQQITVNLITTPVTIPADIEGNVPRV